MVLRQVERLARCRRLNGLVLAIPDDPRDDTLDTVLRAAGLTVFRGDLNDVLGRFVGALRAAGSPDTVVRLTADCPLADPEVIDATIALFQSSGADYTSNTGDNRTFPIGLDAEVFRTSALLEADRETADPYDREHVTPFLYRRPERYRITTHSQAAQEGTVRWTVDRPDDLAFVREVYGALHAAKPDFSRQDVRRFVASRPDLATFGGDRRL
jgi:spore coat polysaccharide biosynthesis protein SpsF